MSREIEIPVELYGVIEKTAKELGYESPEKFVEEAIKWRIRSLKKGLYSVRVNGSVMQLLAEAVKKTGKSMEDLTAEDVHSYFLKKILRLSEEELRLLQAIVDYGKEYDSIEEYVRKTVLNALANDLIEAGNEIERKS